MCLCSLRSEWICCHQLALFLWQASAASLEPLPLSLDFRRGFLHVCPALSFWSRPQGALWDVITTYHNNDPMAVVAKAQVCNSACNTSSSGTVKESMRLRHSFGESISSSAHENITIAVLSCDEEDDRFYLHKPSSVELHKFFDLSQGWRGWHVLHKLLVACRLTHSDGGAIGSSSSSAISPKRFDQEQMYKSHRLGRYGSPATLD